MCDFVQLAMTVFAKTASWLGKELGLGLSTIPFGLHMQAMIVACNSEDKISEDKIL